jgi:hypothetical protein
MFHAKLAKGKTTGHLLLGGLGVLGEKFFSFLLVFS